MLALRVPPTQEMKPKEVTCQQWPVLDPDHLGNEVGDIAVGGDKPHCVHIGVKVAVVARIGKAEWW